MPTLHELMNGIDDELHGALEYADKAVALSVAHPRWSRVYSHMSRQELAHAHELYKIGADILDALTWVDPEIYDRWGQYEYRIADREDMISRMLP